MTRGTLTRRKQKRDYYIKKNACGNRKVKIVKLNLL